MHYKNILACLGPEGTYSSKAAKKYLSSNSHIPDVEYFENIEYAISSDFNHCKYGIIAIENTCEGFITRNIKSITSSNYKVIDEVILPINFSFVHNCNHFKDVEQVYVHSIAKTQTSNFLKSLDKPNIVLSSSNANSYESYKRNRHNTKCGAIVPRHLVKNEIGLSTIPCINDENSNHTRFFILERDADIERDILHNKSYLSIFSPDNKFKYPLENLLSISKSSFSVKNITPVPTTNELGSYQYFTEIEINSNCTENAIHQLINDKQWNLIGALKVKEKKERPKLMVGRNGLVCRCHNVHINSIHSAINASDGIDIKLDVMNQTKASTGCGGCSSLVDEIILNSETESVMEA